MARSIKIVCTITVALLLSYSVKSQSTSSAQTDKLETLKNAYEEMSEQDVSMELIRSMYATSEENMQVWKKVLDFHKDKKSSPEDIQLIETLVSAMEVKLRD